VRQSKSSLAVVSAPVRRSWEDSRHSLTFRRQVLATLFSMSKISIIAKLTAADGRSEALGLAIRSVVEAAAEEPGLEVYSAHSSDDESGVYYFFEIYADAGAKAEHGKGEGMRAAMGAFAGLLAARPEVTTMTPIVAKGLNL
jgi:quinol monooxygenase YgiN